MFHSNCIICFRLPYAPDSDRDYITHLIKIIIIIEIISKQDKVSLSLMKSDD